MTKRVSEILWIGVLSVLWAACSKEASYRTDVQLKPLVQLTSASPVEPLRTMVAYAYPSLDTVRWTVANYRDAVEGIITERATGKTRQDGIKAVPLPLEGSGAGEPDGGGNGDTGGGNGDNGGDGGDNPDDLMATWQTVRVDASRVLLVVADTETEQFGYEELPLAVNLSPLTVSVVFYPWTQASTYRKGGWWMFNPTFIPAEESPLQVYPLVSTIEGDDPQVLTRVVLHAYEGYDGAEWRPLSYDDAVAGIVTRRTTGEQVTATTEFRPINKGDRPGRWGALLDERSLIVAVDTFHRQYATATLDPGSRTDPALYELLFLSWTGAQQYSSGVWSVIVAPAPEPEPEPENPDPENPENPADPENPTDPVTPENPADPENPGDSDALTGSGTPKTSGNAENPENPVRR